MLALTIVSALGIYVVLVLITIGIYWYSVHHAKLDPEQNNRFVQDNMPFNNHVKKNALNSLNMDIKNNGKPHQFHTQYKE